MVLAKPSVSMALVSDLLARYVIIARKVSEFAPIWTSEFHENYRRVKRQLETLQTIRQKYFPLSVKLCAAYYDPAENFLAEALQVLEVAEQFHKDTLFSLEKPGESPLFCSDFGVTSSKSGHLSSNEADAQPTILVCWVGGHESQQHLLSGLLGMVNGPHHQDDILGVVFASELSRPSYLKTYFKPHIPVIYISYQKSWVHAHHSGPSKTDDLRSPREPAFPHFSPAEEPVILSVKCVNLEELNDCIAWSVRLLAQKRAAIAKPSKPSPVTLRHQQSRMKGPTSDHETGIDHPIYGLDPHSLWWSTLALFWIAYAQQKLDGTELISALVAAGEDLFPVKSNLFAGSLGDPGGPGEIGLNVILSESLIISEDGRILVSSEEAKTVLLCLVSDPNGTDEASIHEMIAYTCLRCIESHQPTSIFRPWMAIESSLGHQSTSSGLLLYAASHWYVHFRLGEHRSQRLSALFHRIVQSALSSDNINYWSGSLGSIQIINVGLWLCAFYDLKLLGRTYLEMGAELVVVDGPETYPLHVAASRPSLGVLELFLTKKPELNVIDCEGMTPLQVAVSYGHLAAVEMLLAAGSDVKDTCTASQETALHIAVHGGHEKIIALLLEQGAEIDAKNALSESPLCIALREGKYAIAKMLVDKGACFPPFSAPEQSITEATYAFRALSFAEQHTSPVGELPQYVAQESVRLAIHLSYS